MKFGVPVQVASCMGILTGGNDRVDLKECNGAHLKVPRFFPDFTGIFKGGIGGVSNGTGPIRAGVSEWWPHMNVGIVS